MIRSIIYMSQNDQHEQCVLICIGWFPFCSTMISFFFLREELNLEQFYFCVLSVENFGIPLPFCIGDKKHAPLAVLLHDAFFRGSCSACSSVSCTLYANDSWRTAQQQVPFSHVTCVVRLAMHIIRLYTVMYRCAD